MVEKGRETLESAAEANSSNPLATLIRMPTTRRRFLKISGAGAATVAVMGTGVKLTTALQTRQVYAANADGLVVADPTRCVGCRRCELACTEYNEGKAQPSMAASK